VVYDLVPWECCLKKGVLRQYVSFGNWRGRLYKLKVLVFEGHNGATVAAPGLLHVQSDTGTYEL